MLFHLQCCRKLFLFFFAFLPAFLSSLSKSLKQLQEEKTNVRFVVLKAEGHVFSSGHDLKEIKSMNSQETTALFKQCSSLMKQIQSHPTPIIVSLDGLAAAAGLQLLSACDMAVCTKTSTFQLPGVRYGLFCTTPAVSAFRSSYSSKMLMQMLLTGDACSADEALRIGLVSHMFESTEQMDDFVTHCATQVAALPADVVSLGKQAFYKQIQMRNASEAMDFASDVMVDNIEMPSCQVGLDAFAGKTKPKWD
jgi:enoyl-CoA hydratase/carnithine racemase